MSLYRQFSYISCDVPKRPGMWMKVRTQRLLAVVEKNGFVVDMRESTRVSRAQTARGQQKDSIGPERREGKSVEQEGRDREEE